MANTPDLWRDFGRPVSGFGSWRPLLRQLDDIFNEAMDTRTDDSGRMMIPQCDMEESDDHYLLSFDMPGLEKDNIDIEMQGNQLVVTGERKQEQEKGEGRSRIVERRYGRFQRAIRLPENVKTDGIEAEYTNGVLKVAVPKSAESGRQKIKIGSGNGSGIFSKLANKLTGGEERKSSEGSSQKSEMKH
ncbi:Hsp20/alpha crystallin family protein [Oligoflexus tunisiensis]|uniref:Hsp20/alpha crystallin family protein n=1 Tax=Oligoflexus tunisiensis TaxID=708132 RepID=UPI00114D330D|nr:Hsp20/alpha crystallin family protein [Oligoflexus tunisiensis]